MTAEEKIKAAEDFLNELYTLDPSSDKFRHRLGAFLSSAQSILYHLQHDFADRFDLDLETVRNKNFRKAAEEKDSKQALVFKDWYDKQYELLLNQRFYGFLVKKRHEDIHTETQWPRWFGPLGPVTVSKDETGKETYYQPTGHYFNESLRLFDDFDPILDARVICKMYLMHLVAIVHDARKLDVLEQTA